MAQAVQEPRIRVLLVEGDDAVRHGVAAALRMRSFQVFEAANCEEAVHHYASRPDIVVTDLRFADGDAVSLLPRLRAIDATVPVFALAAITKPLELANLAGCIERAIAGREAAKSGKRRKVALSTIALRSEAMRRLEADISRLRSSDCTVLILGETGTGKSVLARRIHDLGARSMGPFVDVNCAGLSRDLVESELFGHDRGAFTGAHAPKQGLFDAANNGTLFLDEIGDIDLQVQPKILKVLEEKRFRRMGEVRERNADVRLVCATHHDLLDAVERKAFRADLYYRISTVTLRVPSLREHAEDIPVLVEHLAPGVELTPSAWSKLSSHPWPGNIRELKNVLERALLLRQKTVVTPSDIRFDSETRSSNHLRVAEPPPESSRTLEQVEREHIVQALAAENGRVKDAASRLGIPRSTLYQKIKSFGIALKRR
jgi:DNA-binding NtrC family response regulator